MRVIEFEQYGGAEVLTQAERPEPEPGQGQVLVRVSATTVNPVDWLTRSGVLASFTPHLHPPYVLGWDLAGTVERDGGGYRAGQRVVAYVPWFAVGTGTYSELVVVEPGWLAPVPDGLDDVTAATVPLNGITARQALDLVRVNAGQTLVVTGASGAVGGFAVQLAAAAGAHVIAVAGAGDEEHVRGLGAKEVLARGDAAALVAAVHELVPGGADAVLDATPVGPELIGAVRDGGTFVTVLDPAIPPAERGVRVDKISSQPDSAQLADLVRAVAAGELTTRVAATLPLAQAADAHVRAEAGGLRGKIVLTL